MTGKRRLRTWRYGELARPGEDLQHRMVSRQIRRLRQAIVLKRAPAGGQEQGHDMAQ